MLKTIPIIQTILIILLWALPSQAQPLKVITLDFIDETGGTTDHNLTGKINSKTFSEKGIYFLQNALLGSQGFTLIDRRDFVRQIEQVQPRDGSDPVGGFFATQERKTPLRPSFFSAARSLNGDAILRGSLIALSTTKQIVTQGGWQTEFIDLKLRVMIQALDTQDGRVLAMEEGKASRKFRQTSSVQTEIGEDDLLELYSEAISSAIPGLEKGLSGRLQNYDRIKHKIWVATSADPAMIEIDGILLGSSPVEGGEIVQGDHTLTVIRPGFEGITKKLMVQSDLKISVPMISNQLSAQERKEAFSNLDLRILKIN